MIRRSVLSLVLAVAALTVAQQVSADDPPPAPPGPLSVINFFSYFENGVTVYEGDVVNFTPGANVELMFGDLFSDTISVNADGSFIYEIEHAPGTNGTTSATAREGNVTSMPRYTNIYVP